MNIILLHEYLNSHLNITCNWSALNLNISRTIAWYKKWQIFLLAFILISLNIRIKFLENFSATVFLFKTSCIRYIIVYINNILFC